MSTSVITVLNNIWALMHAASAADAIVFSDAEATRLINDRLRHLCQSVGVDIQRTTITLVSGQATYAAPPDHLSTIAVAYANVPLRPASTFELERRDPTLATAATVNAPVRWWYEDKIGVNRIGFFPVPAAADDGQPVEIIYHHLICDIDEGHTVTTFNLPPVFGDWLELAIASEFYGQESDLRSADCSAAIAAIVKIYKTAFTAFYSRPQ